jgi:Uma2 family endonuclease
MTEHTKSPATYADLEKLPQHLVGEILFGALVTYPRPSPRHGGAVSALSAISTNAFQFGIGGPGGWIFVVEPELHLGPHVAVPDIAGWRRERLAELPDKAFFEVAPDWICEVISPSAEKYDKGDKRPIYAHYAVPHLWHVDPRAKTLEVFRLQGRDWLLTHTFVDREDVSAPPFDAITFSLGLLWPFDPPATETPSDERS